jgi:DHA1 family tetracycline resistance protein-like MFS transporter
VSTGADGNGGSRGGAEDAENRGEAVARSGDGRPGRWHEPRRSARFPPFANLRPDATAAAAPLSETLTTPPAPAIAPGARRVGARSSGRGRSPLAVLFVTVFLDLVGFGIVIPLLPLYAERFGAGPVGAAWLLAVYSLMQFLFAPWWGRLSDRVGRRPVLLVGLFGAAASYLAFGVAGSLAALFIARAASGIMGANVGVAQAYIADVTPPEERARGMGMIGAAFGLGFILGPALGGILSRWGPAAPFVGAAALAALNGVLAWYRLPESLPPEARAGRAPAAGLAARLATVLSAPTALRRLYLAGFLATLALACVEAIVGLWAVRRWGATPETIGYGFAIIGIVAAAAQGLMVGPLVRRLGERRLALLWLALLALAMAAIPAAPTLPLVAAAFALWAVGHAAATPAISAMVSHRAGPAEQGRLLAASQSLSALGRVLGPWWGGVALAHVGLAAPYLGAAVAALLALGVLAAAEVAR